MKIQSIDIKNFKRFSDLSITDIPIDTKLVLLIGENGSGKSSIFDAFEWISGFAKRSGYVEGEEYYKKRIDQATEVNIRLDNFRVIEMEDLIYLEGRESAKNFYGRTSLRIVPRISDINFTEIDLIKDSDAPGTYIDYDNRFQYDVIKYTQDINKALREPIFTGKVADTAKIFRDYIAPLNDSLSNIFGESEATVIKLVQYEDATTSSPPRLIFQKGTSKINYDLLSHGEKQVVIILLNLLVRKELFDDIIFFIDEMDAHMNTALQFNLVKEVTENWIPDSCQLWTASHSLGFIEYATQNKLAQIIDFDQMDFDQKQTLRPISKETLDVYEVAVPKELILEIFKDKKIIICERSDSEYYNLALGDSKVIFIPARDSKEVFLTAKSQASYFGLRDRDYLKDEEVKELRSMFPNFKVLDLYSFENYLYHPDNIEELGIPGFSKADYIAEITKQKNEKLVDIASKIATSRQHYEEFKMDSKIDKKTKENIEPILSDLKRDQFNVFFKYFSWKKYFSASYLAPFNLTRKQLAETNWFRESIQKILD